MTEHMISASVVILAVVLVRAVFRDSVPKRFIYALWAVVFIRLVVPGTIFDIPVPVLSDYAETYEYSSPSDMTAEAERAETVITENSSAEIPQTPSVPITAPEKIPVQTDSWDRNSVDVNAILSKTMEYAYIIGFFAVVCWIVLSELAVWRILRKNRRFLRKDGYINIYVSDAAVAPCTYGVIPAIYLTPEIADSSDISLVLKHEQAHIRQLDNIRGVLRRLVAAVYWFNPLVWLYVTLVERDAEFACDEAVASGLDEKGRLEYARMIFDYAPKAKSSVASFGGKPMKKRIQAITKTSSFKLISIILALSLTATLCLFGFVGCVGVAETADESEYLSAESNVSEDSTKASSDAWKEKLKNPSLPEPEDYAGEETTYAENGMPVWPSLEYRANSDYVRSCAGGINFTYEELVSMSSEDIAYLMLAPTTRKNHFSNNPMLSTSLQVEFVDESGEIHTAYVVDEFLFDSYESFVQEIRTYFSEDMAAELFSEGEYFEYGDMFFTTLLPKTENVHLFHSIDYEIVSVSETEIVYRGNAKYFNDEEEYSIYMENLKMNMTFPEESFEIKEYRYVLSLQEDGRWVFTEYEF